MKAIALCTNVTELDYHGGFRDPAICKKYPGSGWAPYLHKYASQLGIEVVSGSDAVHAVGSGMAKIQDLQVIQEELNSNAKWLIQKGADPSLLFCFESPIFASKFYDELPAIKHKFKRQMLFGHWEGTDKVYFPSYDQNDIQTPLEWGQRHEIVAVLSSKHYSSIAPQNMQSPSFKYAIDHQLHDARYRALGELHNQHVLKVYGRGWPDGFADPVDDKIEAMKLYKYALCMENGSYPGYITEKVIDCFVAGVVPIYAGAPDWEDYLPITAVAICDRDTNWQAWPNFKRLLDGSGQRMIHDAQKFLRSPEGQRHSYQGFAKNVLSILGHDVSLLS